MSDDLISRQAAIDAIKSRKTAEQSSAGIMRNAVVDFCIDIVKKLPSAQPQRCSDILDELKDDDYYNYIHTGHSRFSEDDWDYLIHNAKEKEKLHEQLDIKADGDLCNRAKCGKEKR